jgi:hypothetical protein
MRGVMVRIIRKSVPPRGKSVVQVTYKKSSLGYKAKLLKAEMLNRTLYYYDDDDDVL